MEWHGSRAAVCRAAEGRRDRGLFGNCVTPSDYNKWLGASISASDLLRESADHGVRITHLDPFVRWTEDWKPHLEGLDFPVDIVGFDEDDFFRMASALRVDSFTAWSGFAPGRYSLEAIAGAFGALCTRAC